MTLDEGTEADAKRLVYFEDEEHLVRRLGSAVIACWTDLPADLQGLLLASATTMIDEIDTGNIEGELQALVRAHARPAGESTMGLS